MSTAKTALTKPQGTTGRKTFSKIAPAMELPNLISVQKESFERFMGEGLAESFAEFSPIENSAHTLQVTFGDHQFGDPAHTIAECRAKDISYQAPLFVDVRFVNKETGEMKEQLVFMGDFPLMTERGTFVINGTERVVVSQLVRSPGVYFASEMDNGVRVHKAQFIPARGAWLEFEVDKRGHLVVSIDRKRRQSATMFLRALGIAETDDEILSLLGDSDVVRNTLERDVATTREDALLEIYRRQRPGEPPTVDSARSLIDGLYFNEQRYDGSPVARMGDEYRALLGYLPQDFGYYPEFTALDFMEYMAALKGLGRRDARDRSLALLERVGLGGEERRRIRTFSGGMRQRLGIAQAVLNDPEVLVLDEPTAGLDPKERVRFRNLIAGLARDKIVLLSTHIVSDVEHIADEILVMRAGSVVLSGRPAELVAEAEGRVWEAVVPAERAEALEATLTVGNVRNLEGGRALLRYVADEPKVPGSAPAEPTLEDLYLYVFRDGGAGAGSPRAARGSHFKEGRHA